MEKLPLEITSDILVRLPIVSQLQCGEVSRTWQTFVTKPKMGLLYSVFSSEWYEPHKYKAQFYLSEQNNDEVSTNHVDEQLLPLETLSFDAPPSSESLFVGSCNGLVCYAGLKSHNITIRRCEYRICSITVYICNPVTGEQIELPTERFENFVCDGINPAIGFGYIRSCNKYKVVIMGRNLSGRDVKVCTLRGGTPWRSKYCLSGKQPLSDLHDRDLSWAGVFAGGALHWIEQNNRMEQNCVDPKTIAFDLEHETFELLPSIPVVVGRDVRLMVLGGNLCALEVGPTKNVMIWEFTYRNAQEHHRRCDSTWVTKFSIALEDYSWFQPVALTNNKSYAEQRVNKCLLWYNAVLSCYDPETKTLRKLDETLRKFMGDCMPSVCTTNRATPHVNSLVSIEVIRKQKGKYTTRRKKSI